MQLWKDGVIALLASVGLATVLWGLTKLVLLAGRVRIPSAVVLLPVSGDGERLEQQARVLAQLRQEKGAFGAILLVDCGLTAEGERLASLLQGDTGAILCKKEQIGSYLPGGDAPG